MADEEKWFILSHIYEVFFKTFLAIALTAADYKWNKWESHV